MKSIVVGDLTEEWYLYAIAYPVSTVDDIKTNLGRYYPLQVVVDWQSMPMCRPWTRIPSPRPLVAVHSLCLQPSSSRSTLSQGLFSLKPENGHRIINLEANLGLGVAYD